MYYILQLVSSSWSLFKILSLSEQSSVSKKILFPLSFVMGSLEFLEFVDVKSSTVGLAGQVFDDVLSLIQAELSNSKTF